MNKQYKVLTNIERRDSLLSKNIWNVKEQDNNIIRKIASENHLPEIIATVLANRGITDPKEIDLFMHPQIHHLHNPFLLKDLSKAVERIQKAIVNHERITIYGDYDVDGITSTSILYMFLKELGGYVDYYIPDRVEEGYGMNENAISKIAKEKTTLLISVDTGITAHYEVEVAKQFKIDVIITDHHECQESLPNALAVINPKRKDCNYPFDALAGVGVTFKLIQGLANLFEKEASIWKYLDIVAVGTIADLVPLQDENRVFTKVAFQTMTDTWNLGLKALMEVAGIDKKKITAGHVGFQIGPRLNAAGRLGDAKRGVQLFITEDNNQAAQLAEELDAENNERQKMEQEILQEAIKIIESTIDVEKTKILVVASEGWNHGVIGIVASRITEKYYRPTILLTVEDDQASGSARSVEGFSIFNALNSCKDLLDKFGGHEMAAGMSLPIDNISLLREKLNEYARNTMTEETLIPKLCADMEIPIEAISIDLIQQIERLEPYGMGNEQPKFICTGKVKQIMQMGKTNNHLKLTVENMGSDIVGVGFNLADYYHTIGRNHPISIFCTLNINEWNNVKSPQLMIKDIQYDAHFERKFLEVIQSSHANSLEVVELEELNKYKPERICYENVYRYLMRIEQQKKNEVALTKLLEALEYNQPEYLWKIILCVKVFKELNLLDYEIVDEALRFRLIKGKKVELTQSKLYNKIN